MSKNVQVYPSQKLGGKNDVEDLENKTTARQIIEKFLNTKSGKYIEIYSTFLSLFSCVIYVVGTYVSDPLNWYENIDIAILSFYFVEYLLRLYTAQHRFHFFTSQWSIVDLSTLIPIFLLNYTYVNFILSQIITISRILRSLRVIRVINKLFKIGDSDVSSVNRQIFTIILTILTLVFVTSGVLLTFEAPYRLDMIQSDKNNNCSSTQITPATFHEMIYFVVVTLATVGYGDVVPYSEEGRVCVIGLIILVLVLIPKQTNELIRLMSMQSKYARAIYKANAEVPHILVCGHVGVGALKNFCGELFHQDHGNQDRNAVILQQAIPTAEMEIFLHNPQYELFLTYLQGNPMVDRDLKRAVTVRAKACVVLTNKYVQDSYSADHKNILTGLAIKKYVHHITNGENIRLCMQLIKPESKQHYYSSLNMKSNDQLIVVEEFKMNLLAKSCFSPGIISMVSNLITSAGDQDKDKFEEEWLKEYVSGMGHEIYRTDLSFKFKDKSFSEVAAIVYDEFQGILFGIELDVGGQTIIRLNPGPYTIPNTKENNVHVYIICEDKKVADQVATYDMSAEDIALYHQQQSQKGKKNAANKDKDKSEDFGYEYKEVYNNDEEEDDKESALHKNITEDNELLESDYILLSEPVSLMSVSPISLKDSNEVTNHIVVCGIHPSIYYFLLPLRARYLREIQYIVILAPEKPTEIWEYINRFPKIRYIKGSPLLGEDLLRANINFADKAVILGKDLSNKPNEGALDEMLDAESIFIYKAIKKCNKNVQVMVELVYSSNIEFLLARENKKDSEFKYELTPLYAAGEVYISSIIDTLTCQSYFNPHIVTILQQILTGGKQSNAVIRAICDHADLKQSNLWQISIPEDYLNKTFGELFNYLCVERHLIPLGLYRLPGALDNHHAYCYTNPRKNVKLTHRDKVFVLAFNMSDDLLSGVLEQKPISSGQNIKQETATDENKPDLDIWKSMNNEMINKKSGGGDQNLSRGGTTKNIFKTNKTDKKQMNVKNQKPQNLDLESINISSATCMVLDQINKIITEMKGEIEKIKENITIQDEEIVDKMKNALHQELTTILQ